MLIIQRNSRVHNHAKDSDKRVARKSTFCKLVGAALLALVVAASSAAPGPRRVEITATRFSFQPAEITLKTGEPVDLVLTSGDVSHGLQIRDLSIDLKASKDKPAEVKFTPGKTGTFTGHCSVFCGKGHGKMTLTVHVTG